MYTSSGRSFSSCNKLCCAILVPFFKMGNILYEAEDSAYEELDVYDSDDELYEMMEFLVYEDGWLTAADPIFWCLAPAYLEDTVWLFRAAPTRQPLNSLGHSITLLEYYIQMDLTELLDRLWLAPKKVHDALCMTWSRVTKHRNLARKNSLVHSLGPELDWLFERDPELPPSWEVFLGDHQTLNFEIFFPQWESDETFV